MSLYFCLLGWFGLIFLASQTVAKLPHNYRFGVNLGGWLLSEAWMNPMEWEAMGGERCPKDLTTCASSEWALARKLGQRNANKVFLKHWKTWFTQDHVDKLKALKLDHVRVPLGFWIVEELVEPPSEMYAQGGWMELKRGLRQLTKAGFYVMLDMHALPGVSTFKDYFAGNVTSEVHFYEDHNYQRALTWSVILTTMTHLDPDFENVVAIECINEPLVNGKRTPGLEQYYADFVIITRIIEHDLSVECEADLSVAVKRLASSRNIIPALQAAIPLIPIYAAKASPEISTVQLIKKLKSHINSTPSNKTTPITEDQVDNKISPLRKALYRKRNELLGGRKALRKRLNSSKMKSAFNVYEEPEESYGSATTHKTCIATTVMSKRWQGGGPDAASMASHTLGPAVFDDHMYYSSGSVAAPDIHSYLTKMCNDENYRKAQQNNEVPYGHGEFSLATSFNATDDELRAWGDAQKLKYSQGRFWTFWSFRVGTATNPPTTLKHPRQWSYLQAVESGLLPRDPSQYFDPSVCRPYLNKSESWATATDNFPRLEY
ncbi:hypothetical protein O181_024002 [Austropuccinia psidii MF-1]|uniref:Glycoside hydrolase family 5 domain-containing protein n=1 Tax=Austropuccinia psidii MF-1 TaxID=1389203 RepID=A0A9Q3GYJ1_9BASI|nr:hypothetical protein [Austropuccinia psidii MF-1]